MQKNWVSSYCGLRVVVTGGWGFLGINLIRRLVEIGSVVVVVDHHAPPMDSDTNAYLMDIVRSVDCVRASIGDQTEMDRVVRNCEILFSLAGKSGASDSVHDPFTDLNINCRGLLTLLEAARRHNPKIRVVFPSSRLVYEKTDLLPVDESHPTEPASIYGIHKLTGEKYCLLYKQLYGIRSTILRLTNPYGPYQRANSRSFGVVNKFISQAALGIPIHIFGEGKQLRDYVHVDDVVDAMLSCAISDEAIGEVFNVGSGQGISMGHMAELMVQISGKGSVVYVPWPAEQAKVETGSFVADIEKVRRVLGWSPKIPLEQGLSKTLEYYHNVLPKMV
jgi:UDP-glucose 4-epimerase